MVIGSTARLGQSGGGLGVGVEQQPHHVERRALGGSMVQRQLPFLRRRSTRRTTLYGEAWRSREDAMGREGTRSCAAAACAARHVHQRCCAPYHLRWRPRGLPRRAAPSPQTARRSGQRRGVAASRPTLQRARNAVLANAPSSIGVRGESKREMTTKVRRGQCMHGGMGAMRRALSAAPAVSALL